MYLNSLSTNDNSRPKALRVGRGIGCTKGKTCGRGHKGQKSRSGGFHKVGFEGGQMPLQRRIPKSGFTSRTAGFVAEISLGSLNRFDGEVSLLALKEAGMVKSKIKRVKVIAGGDISKAITLHGLQATESVKKLIEAAGGKII